MNSILRLPAGAAPLQRPPQAHPRYFAKDAHQHLEDSGDGWLRKQKSVCRGSPKSGVFTYLSIRISDSYHE